VRALAVAPIINLPRRDQLSIDSHVVWFTAALAVATGIIFGLVPALQMRDANLQATLRSNTRGGTADGRSQLVRRALVVAEIALALTLLTGGAYFHHADSFAMMRGGHLDFCVLGAFQVSASGDLANWHTGAANAIPAVGGAMDLAIGAKRVLVMMEHQTKTGESKIVAQCSYPLTGVKCVNRIYTDLAVIDVTPDGLAVVEIVEGLDFDELARITGVSLRRASGAERG